MPKLSGKSIMVTGGAGFIGSHLVDRIIQEKPGSLVVVDNLFLGKEYNLSSAREQFPALRFYREDAADYSVMERIAVDEDIEVIFNLAVVPLPLSIERPRETIDINVSITTAVCELLRHRRARTLIQYSSSEVYGTAMYTPMEEDHPYMPCTPYAASKLATDYIALSYLHTFGVDVTVVRPFNNYGPRQNEGSYAGVIPIVVHRILNGEPITIYGDGEQTRDFVFVRDVADATVRIYEEEATRGRIINLGSGQEISINQVVQTLLELMHADNPVVYDTPRPGDVRRHCANVERARQLIGYAPRTSIRAGLAEAVAWYQELQMQKS